MKDQTHVKLVRASEPLLCRKGTELQYNIPKNRDYVPLSRDRVFEVYSAEKLLHQYQSLSQSLFSKQRNAGKSQLNESTLLNRIHKRRIGDKYIEFLLFKFFLFISWIFFTLCANE